VSARRLRARARYDVPVNAPPAHRPRLAPRLLALALLLALPVAARGQSALDQARAHRRAGRPEQAVAVLDEALARAPDDGSLLGLLGLCLLEAGELARAEALAEQLHDYRGDAFRPHVFLGHVHGRARRTEPAIAAYRRALEVNPQCVEALHQLCALYVATGSYGRALKHAERLHALRPELGLPLLAATLAAQGDEQRRAGAETLPLAADSFLAAHELMPDDRVLGERALDTLVLAVRLDDAARVADTLFPGRDADWHGWMGTIRAAAMDAAAARAHFEAALASRPEHPRAALGLARLLVDDGDYERARELLAVVRARDPDSGSTALLLGEVLVALGELDEGIASLRRAVELDPVQPKGHYQLARALLQAGRREEGAAAMARSRELQEASAPEVVR